MMCERQHLLRDERGAALIEMGFVAPILAALLMGMVDISRGYSTKLQLEQAAQRTLESVQQKGYSFTSSSVNDNATIDSEAETAAGTGSSATVTSYAECWNGSSKTTTTYNGTCTTGLTVTRYVKIEITKTYTSLFGFKFLGASSTGTQTVSGKAAIRVQ